MQRVRDCCYLSDIQKALECIPARFHRFIYCDFLCGVDPISAGLFFIEKTTDGRSYRNTMCCVYEINQLHLPADMRKTTVSIPQKEHPFYIIHELGHVLQGIIDPEFKIKMQPVTEYAKKNNLEAFAEAFARYTGEDFWVIENQYKDLHPADRAFFDRIN
jgi:hypothetical protein